MLADTAVLEATEKLCRKCGEVYPLAYFDRKSDARDGYTSICKTCHREDARQRAEKAKAENNMIDDGCLTPGNPYVYLARSVIRYAVRDWKRRNAPRAELMIFFKSHWFEDLSDLAGVNPEVIRERLGIC